MSDFMRWLYAHYIKPQLKNADQMGYETHISLLDMDLTQEQKEDYEKALELYASEAFLLGLRTGVGLSGSLQG